MTKYNEENINMAIELRKLGATKTYICKVLDIARSTLFYWEQKEEFNKKFRKAEIEFVKSNLKKISGKGWKIYPNRCYKLYF